MELLYLSGGQNSQPSGLLLGPLPVFRDGQTHSPLQLNTPRLQPYVRAKISLVGVGQQEK